AHLAVVVPPMILSDPTSQLVTNGGFVVLSVSAEGDEPLSYQWYFNETNSVAEATNAMLALSNVTPAQAGSYVVTVSNAYGSVTSALAQLTVVVPAGILSGPVGQLAANGDTVTLTVIAEGTAPLTYQWYFGQNSLADATDAALILHQVSPGQAGDYAVVVRNDYGSATSAPAHLSVA